MDFSVGIARFGAILKETECSSRSGPVQSCQFGCRYQAVASGEGSAHDLNPLVPAWGVGRENGGQSPVTSEIEETKLAAIKKCQNKAKLLGC